MRTVVAPLPERQLARLSPELVGLHHWMVRRQQGQHRPGVSAAAFATGPLARGVGL